MNKIISSQGKQTKTIQPGSLTYDVCAPTSGTIISINNLQMARVARRAGAPMDKGAGVDLFKKVGDTVEKGDCLYRVHAEFKSDYQFACDMTKKDNGYAIR